MERMAKLATVYDLPAEVIDNIGSELRWNQWAALLKDLKMKMFVPSYRLKLFNFVVDLLQKFPNDQVFVAGGVAEFLNGQTSEFGDIDVFFEPKKHKDKAQYERVEAFFRSYKFCRHTTDPEDDLEYHNLDFHVYSTDMKFDSKHPVQIILLQNVTEGDIATKVTRRLQAFDHVTFCSSALYFDGPVLTFTTLPFGDGRGVYGNKRLEKYLMRTGLKEKPLVREEPWLRFIGVKNSSVLKVDDFNFGHPSHRLTRSKTRANGLRKIT